MESVCNHSNGSITKTESRVSTQGLLHSPLKRLPWLLRALLPTPTGSPTHSHSTLHKQQTHIFYYCYTCLSLTLGFQEIVPLVPLSVFTFWSLLTWCHAQLTPAPLLQIRLMICCSSEDLAQSSLLVKLGSDHLVYLPEDSCMFYTVKILLL